MHPIPFDVLTVSLGQGSTRRRLAQLLGRAVLGTSSRRLLPDGLASLVLASAVLPETATAKKRGKKLKFNAFGCVNVGGKCHGQDAACCSGICQGKKPKKGKRDKRRCVAHDTGDCAPGQGTCKGPISCTTSTGDNGFCYATTGNAGFCGLSGPCSGCRRDTDCHELWGPSAACLVCAGCPHGTFCGNPV